MKSYLSDRKQIMKVGLSKSSVALVTKGVPQGLILGPLLLNLMVNDMLDAHTQTYSYADDTLTYFSGVTQSAALELVM